MLMHSACAESLPRVSIGMPVYNGERWLDETLQALRAQTLSDFEVIISDNASVDATPAICARHAAQDARIRYYRNARNIGANRNYVAVLKRARAEYFKWTSSNDLCDPRFLERCVGALEAEPGAALAYPGTILFADNPREGTLYEGDLSVMQESAAARFAYVMCKMRLNNAVNGVIRTALLRRSHFETFQSADIVMMGELALLGKFVRIAEPMFFRRMSEESATLLQDRVAKERHIEPSATAPLRWQHWKYQWGVMRGAMLLAPLGSQKLAAVIFALKSIVWARSDLMSDVRAAMGIGP